MNDNYFQNVAIIGSNGAIGSALVDILSEDKNKSILAFSRNTKKFKKTNIFSYNIDIENENSIQQASIKASQIGSLDLVILATGFLHDSYIKPEKSLNDIKMENFQKLYLINSIGPALIARFFLPILSKEKKSLFAVLSARVGSISDNRLGGWYAYRSSKAALNMIIKNAAIEMARKNKKAIVTGLHPGTVNSNLSLPFQSNVKKDQLFSASYAASKLLDVVNNLNISDSGRCFAWDQTLISP